MKWKRLVSALSNENWNPGTAGLMARLARDGRAVLVRVLATEGSVPRERGAWMAVWPRPDAAPGEAAPEGRDPDMLGTVGGGHLEYEAIAHARAMLRGTAGASARERRFVLGPSLGQCCGGVVVLGFEPVAADDTDRLRALLPAPRAEVALFGGGHVGWALVQALAPLPLAVTWIDSRGGIFPAALPPQVRAEHSDPVQGAVAGLAPGSRVVIMSFSHAEDLDIVAACLRRQRERADLPYIGLIGSKTKWATFRHRLQARGFGDADLAHVTCPIGVPGIHGKAPEVIAVAVAAQILQTLPED